MLWPWLVRFNCSGGKGSRKGKGIESELHLGWGHLAEVQSQMCWAGAPSLGKPTSRCSGCVRGLSRPPSPLLTPTHQFGRAWASTEFKLAW